MRLTATGPWLTSMDSGDPALTPLAVTVSQLDRVFPTLTPEQVSRIASHGRRRSTISGDVLVEVGDRAVPVFVVISGELQAFRPAAAGDTLIVSLQVGQFSGEVRRIVALEGNGSLARVRWRDDRTGDVETHDIRHVFIMMGAVPNTRWLNGCLALDDNGFVKTGPDLSSEELANAKWPLARPPHLLETNRPRIFAVGDVRGGNIKRVASAVGEGSIAVAFVHQVLRE